MKHLILFVKKIIALPDWLSDWNVSEHPEWRGRAKGLWIEPGPLLTLINGWQVAQWAIPLLAAALVLYGFQIQIVWADAAYFTKKILRFIYHHLRATPFVDFNVRRNNKQIVTLEFIVAWEGLMAPRSDIERHFAWAKRYFGLKYFQIEG